MLLVRWNHRGRGGHELSVEAGVPGGHPGAVSQGWGCLVDRFPLEATAAGPLFLPWLTPASLPLSLLLSEMPKNYGAQ